MTVAALKSYSAGIGSLVVEWTTADDYCVSCEINGRKWWKQGPAGQISQNAC